ncbi:glycoside hydrolase family 38 protein [Clavulina sp. PMI_390]|nr:glycoside hydrolase family 38 protein [Clavulina sp. PMI_390]
MTPTNNASIAALLNGGNDNGNPSIAEAINKSAYPEQNFGVGNKWVKNLFRDRLGTFLGGHYDDVNLSHVLFSEREDSKEYVKLLVWSAHGRDKPSFHEAMEQADKDGWKEAKKGDSFGPSWTNHWWKVSLRIPSDWDKKYERIQLEFDPGCEALIYTTSGTPLHAITGGYGGDRRVEYIIPAKARKEGKLDLVIESTCNGMFGVPWSGNAIDPPDMNRYFGLASADLVVPNQEAWRLMWDWNIIRAVIDHLPGNNALQNKAIIVANEIMDVFKHNDPSTVSKARKVAEKILGEGWDAKAEGVYNEGPREKRVWGIGHCHIDTAWLWPYSVTQQKVARSWTTQVDLMERYPEHRFAASSAQQWKWLEQLYPEAFESVKKKVLAGKFHPIGGSWVENDANMPSGESLSRQLIYGQRFFQSRFNGLRCETGWLPDSFGLTGQLPQIMREAGMSNFFTQKLSWNNINVFPHTTFNWVGFDGTQVLCHMTPVDTYTAQADMGDVRRGVLGHKNLESHDSALLVFGNGDGGGGPLAPMLEGLRRIRAVANSSIDTEIPVVHMGTSVEDFYDDIHKQTNHGATLPAWHGELYLEFHRGTYTSHGIIKKGNRKSEVLLREVELITTLVSLYKNSYTYPKTRIDDMWEGLLLNQFHDVLPGSAIGMVYEDAEKIYNWIAKESKQVIKEALKKLIPRTINLPLTEETTAAEVQALSKGRVVALNTVHAPRREIVPISLSNVATSSAHAHLNKLIKEDVVQLSRDGKTGYVVAEHTGGAGLSPVTGLFASALAAPGVGSGGARAFETRDGDFVLKNSNIQMKISNGRIVSLWDVLLERELIPEGKTAGLMMFTDRPTYWDAWDTEVYDVKSGKPLEFTSLKVLESGPAYASLESVVKYDKSTIKITISITSLSATLAEDSRSYIRFDADVDWRQRHEFLKFEIPLNIHAQEAIFDAAFGNVARATHRNTSVELAKFEVCGHKYADLSEYGYGLAILSESKYGFAAEGNVLRISLLRSATAPDPEQDQGAHSFSWALLPHASHFHGSDVPLAGYFFNSPVHLHYAPEEELGRFGPLALTGQHGLFSVEGAPNVLLETVKRSDDDDLESGKGDQHIILRLYEAYGGHAKATLRVSSKLRVTKATLTNLLEDEKEGLQLQACPAADGRVGESDTIIEINFRGFQFQTVKLTVEAAHDRSV